MIAHDRLEPGDRMEDDTVYAGVSPDTGRPMYTTQADAPLSLRWKEALDYAHDGMTGGHGHDDWRVPTKNELNVLFNNRATIGGFNESGSNPAGSYWSSTETDIFGDAWAWAQRFSDGDQHWRLKQGHPSLRCVRG
jgi:hypothetical protein